MEWTRIAGGIALILGAVLVATIALTLPARYMPGWLFWREVRGSTETTDLDESYLLLGRLVRWAVLGVAVAAAALGLWFVASGAF